MKSYKIRKNKAKRYVIDVKKKGKCVDCKETRHYVLDFHYLGDKKYTIAEMAKRGLSIKVIQKEMDKCILLCSNCHRERHYLNK